ncbi:MAG: hypothetical protein U0X76_04900 [Bacteroidia bacterium]
MTLLRENPRVAREVVMTNGKETLVKFIVVADGMDQQNIALAKRALRQEVEKFKDTVGKPFNGYAGEENPFVYFVLHDNM